jgi:putative ABC transport system substrate-binding protein
MKKFIILITLICLLFLTSCQQEKLNLIAIATYTDNVTLNIIRDSFIDELIKLGYTKPKGWNIIIKNANGLPQEATMVAEELLNMNPKVVVSISTAATKPVYDLNQGRIPHVYSFVSFPEVIGIKKGSKNTTGLSDGVDFEGSFFFIKRILPNIRTLGMIYSDEPNAIYAKTRIAELCKNNNVQFIGQAIARQDEVKQACQALATHGVDAMLVGADSTVIPEINAIIEVSYATKIPLFSMDEGSIEAGGLAALSVNYEAFGKETAQITDEVIKHGIDNLESQKVYIGKDIVINLKTANHMGIKISDEIIKSAYKVFE